MCQNHKHHKDTQDSSPTRRNFLKTALGVSTAVIGIAGIKYILSNIETIGKAQMFLSSIKQTKVLASADPSALHLPKEHYIELVKKRGKLIFRMACCQPLEIRAASIDGKIAPGEYIVKELNRIAYRFDRKGDQVVIDIQRGSHLQRLTFTSGQSILHSQSF